MKINNLFSAMKISSAGLTVQRKRLDAIASNLANAETTRTENGGPYKRQIVQVKTEKIENKFSNLVKLATNNLASTNSKHIPEQAIIDGPSIQVTKAEIVEDNSAPRLVYDPDHPDANKDGYVAKPNINTITEMVDLISATRSFEANTNAISAAKNMYKDALEI